MKAPPKPVSASTRRGSEQTSVIRRRIGQDILDGGDAEVGDSEGAGGDATAREIEGAVADAFGHEGVVGVDGADDLERVLGCDGRAKFSASGEGLRGDAHAVRYLAEEGQDTVAEAKE